jgi:hypothetical protein
MAEYSKAIRSCLETMDSHKLDSSLFQLEGFSGRKTRIFYNKLLQALKGDVRYLEIGVWKGSTFCSALYNNDLNKAVAVDNWSEFNGSITGFQETVRKTCGDVKYDFLDGDCFSDSILERCKALGPFNVYLYDGNHEEEFHEMALTKLRDCLDDTFIYICDDWNWSKVKNGTIKGLQGYNIIDSVEIHTNYGNDFERTMTWWNGIMIAVLKKI